MNKAFYCDLLLQPSILRRVHAIDAGADDRHGTSASSECCRVCCSVDAGGEPADDRNIPLGESSCELARLLEASRTCLAGADDGDGRGIALIGCTAQKQDWRALVDHPEIRWVLGVEDRDHPDPCTLPTFEVPRSPLHIIRLRCLEEGTLGRRFLDSGCTHAAIFLELFGHRGPHDLRPS